VAERVHQKRYRFVAEFDCHSVGQALRVGAALNKLLETAAANGGVTSPDCGIDGPLRAGEKSLVEKMRR
jgi:hypothetical protein